MFQIEDLDAESGTIAMDERQNILLGNGETSVVRVVIARVNGGQTPRGNSVYQIHDDSLKPWRQSFE